MKVITTIINSIQQLNHLFDCTAISCSSTRCIIISTDHLYKTSDGSVFQGCARNSRLTLETCQLCVGGNPHKNIIHHIDWFMLF